MFMKLSLSAIEASIRMIRAIQNGEKTATLLALFLRRRGFFIGRVFANAGKIQVRRQDEFGVPE
jgi:hypothetical protein